MGGPVKQSQWLNEFQALSKVPLLISMDAEWGVAMRLDSVVAFPWSMTLGAIKDNAIIRKIGQRMGEQEKILGVHMSYAPVLDINTNPQNPIIGNRSFGEDPKRVVEKGVALMRGTMMQEFSLPASTFPDMEIQPKILIKPFQR